MPKLSDTDRARLIALGYPDSVIPDAPTPDQAQGIKDILVTGLPYADRLAEIRAAWAEFFSELRQYQNARRMHPL